MGETGEAEIRGRCGCGRRYRIRNAKPDVVVSCPKCGRTIMITRADLMAAGAGETLIPLQPEQAEPLEALLVDEVELRPAPSGSEPGLTGRQVHTHEAALLADALEPSRRGAGSGPYSPGAPCSGRPGAFLRDMLASLWFAGRPRNAAMLGVTIVACALPVVLAELLRFFVGGFLITVVYLVVAALMVLHVVQFFWHVMTATAGGEDELPLVPPKWEWVDDALKPLFWLVAITVLCSLPTGVVAWFVPTGQYRLPLIWGALAVGSLVWPIALLSIALAGTVFALRPDRLVRSIFGVGPAYFAAWLLMVAIAGAAVVFVGLDPVALGWPPIIVRVYPLAAVGLVFYLAYVLFRTLGLLFRHFGQRLPW